MSGMCSKAYVLNSFGVYPVGTVEASPEKKTSAAA